MTLFLLASDKPSVVLHQFANQQEGINGCDAVADEVGYQLTLGIGLLGHEKLVP